MKKQIVYNAVLVALALFDAAQVQHFLPGNRRKIRALFTELLEVLKETEIARDDI